LPNDDIGLPGLDGYEVARHIRSQLWGNKVLLIAVTGYGRSEDRDAVMRAGFDAHVVKPINAKDLVRTITQLKSRE
jgi:CheY-like chemotaxis protein